MAMSSTSKGRINDCGSNGDVIENDCASNVCGTENDCAGKNVAD